MAPRPTFSLSTPPRQMSEIRRRNLYLAKQLDEAGERVTPERYQELLREQERSVPLQEVDRVIGYQPSPSDNKSSVEARSAEGIDRARSNLRGGLYAQGIQQGDGQQQDKNYFPDRKIPRWTPRKSASEQQLELRFLQQRADEFGKFRQQLNQNHSRLDGLGKTVFDQMEGKYRSLLRARTEGRLTMPQFLKEVDNMSNQAQEINWKNHIAGKGQKIGEWSVVDGIKMQMTKDGPQPRGLTKEYIKEQSYIGDDGTTWQPVMDKEGMIRYESIDKNRDGIPDSEQKEKLQEKLGKMTDEYYRQRADILFQDEENPPTVEQLRKLRTEARAFAAGVLKEELDEIDALFNPNARSPAAESMARFQAEEAAAIEAAAERGTQEGMAAGAMEHQMVTEEAVDQVMKKYDVDAPAAAQYVQDDMYMSQFESQPYLAEIRQLQSMAANPPQIDPARADAFARLVKDKDSPMQVSLLQAKFWQDDPSMVNKYNNPIPYVPGKKIKKGQVYLRRKKDGLTERFFVLPNKTTVKLTPPWQKSKEDEQKAQQTNVLQRIRGGI